MLTLENISKSIKTKKIVDNISFDIKPGTINGLLGPNGAGKTTTFYLIAGLIKCDYGKIIFDDKNITPLPMHKRSKLGIKYLPQEPSIFQNLTVYENLYGLAEISFQTKEEITLFMDQSINEFNLTEILNLKGRQLSGGQRRKVEIARTLAADPKVILLDEPFAGIDPIAILITDHNVREALEICHKAIVINNGSVIATGSKEELISNDLVKKVYLGNMYS